MHKSAHSCSLFLSLSFPFSIDRQSFLISSAFLSCHHTTMTTETVQTPLCWQNTTSIHVISSEASRGRGNKKPLLPGLPPSFGPTVLRRPSLPFLDRDDLDTALSLPPRNNPNNQSNLKMPSVALHAWFTPKASSKPAGGAEETVKSSRGGQSNDKTRMSIAQPHSKKRAIDVVYLDLSNSDGKNADNKRGKNKAMNLMPDAGEEDTKSRLFDLPKLHHRIPMKKAQLSLF